MKRIAKLLRMIADKIDPKPVRPFALRLVKPAAVMSPEKIRSFRIAMNMSQAELAARLGVDQSVISRAESGTPLSKPAALLLEMLMRDTAPAQGAAA